MSAGILDVHYSVERHFAANHAALNLVFEGVKMATDSITSWVHVSVLTQVGRPSRSDGYSADLRLSMRVHSRASQRAARDVAATLEAALRGATIDVYDRDNTAGDPIGHIRLLDPAYQTLPTSGTVHMGVLDVTGVLDMDLS